MTSRQWRLSAFILVVLGLQAVAVIHELGGGRETLWPFLPWGMFRQSASPPVEAVRIRIHARTPSGWRRVGPADAGFDRFAFRLHYRTRLAEGDSAVARELANRLRARWSEPVRVVTAGSDRYTLDGGRYRVESTVRGFRIEAP
jgi:hypothetical protein